MSDRQVRDPLPGRWLRLLFLIAYFPLAIYAATQNLWLPLLVATIYAWDEAIRYEAARGLTIK